MQNECLASQLTFKMPSMGKCPSHSSRDQAAKYRCLCRIRGYGACDQRAISVKQIDQQIKQAIMHLTIPANVEQRITNTVEQRKEHNKVIKQQAKIHKVIDRIDFRWENGLIPAAEYIQRRSALQQEIEALRPVKYDELLEAKDLIENFESYWEQCALQESPDEARQQLFGKIVNKVFVYDDQVIAIALHADFGIILDVDSQIPQKVSEMVSNEVIKNGNITKNVSIQCGSDGHWTITGCMVWAPQDGVYHIVIREILEQLLTLPQYLELIQEKDESEASPKFPWSN